MADASIEIDYNLCENTQTCEAVCPVDVFEFESGRVVVRHAFNCNLCFKCVELCPSGAINIDY